MKHYRLINSLELHDLNQYFNQVVQCWNDDYCDTPLTICLELPPKNDTAIHAGLIHENNKPMALVERNYLNVIKHALFGEMHACFNSISHDLALILFSNLFKTKQCQFNQLIQEQPEWFYAGSTCLLLTLSCDKEDESPTYFTLTLNPDWVYQQLPQTHSSTKTLHCLDEALAEQTLKLNIELIPSTLSVTNLSGLQVGDVLSTDHHLDMPLRLTRGTQLVAQAALGQSSQHKSIILKR